MSREIGPAFASGRNKRLDRAPDGFRPGYAFALPIGIKRLELRFRQIDDRSHFVIMR